MPPLRALGLCKAGVAVGCSDGTGPAQACQTIEASFEDATGGPAPWVGECPCDFSAVSPQLDTVGGPWRDTADNAFECTSPLPDTSATSEFLSYLGDGTFPPGFGETWLRTSTHYDVSTHRPRDASCTIVVETVPVIKTSMVVGYMGITEQDALNMGRACLRNLIAYGNAFEALNPGVIDVDLCD